MARQHSRGPTRKTLWLGFNPVRLTLSAAGGSIAHSLNAAALALRPFTIVRSHFVLMVISDQAAAIEEQVGAFGLAVVSSEAVNVGVTAVPTPVTESGSSLFFVHQFYMAAMQEITDRAVGPEIYQVDSKAMRKVEVGQDIITIGEFDATGGGQILTLAGRVLIKTH